MPKTIIITGSVATGKTTLARRISEELNYDYLDIKQIIIQHGLCEAEDKDRDCIVVDEKKLSKILEKNIKESKKDLVLDSHMAHYLSPKLIDLCIITKCNLKVLEQRLKDRKYKKSKIQENMQAEIFDICLLEAKELKHNILIIDTTDRITQKEMTKIKLML